MKTRMASMFDVETTLSERVNAFGNKHFRRGAWWRAHIDEKTARLRARSLSIKKKDFYRSTPYTVNPVETYEY